MSSDYLILSPVVRTVRAADVCGPFCVSTSDAQILHDRIQELARDGARVFVSLNGVSCLLTCFANAAFGQLLHGWSRAEFEARIAFTEIAPEDLATIERSLSNTLRYLANPAAYDAAWAEMMGSDTDYDESTSLICRP